MIIKGFDEEGISKFIQNHEIIHGDKLPPQIKACFQIPIVLCLVTYSAEDCLNPTSITDIYHHLVDKMAQKHNSASTEESLLQLDKLASVVWDGIHEDRYEFECDDIETLGLMEQYHDKPDVVIKMKRKFHHETVQQYLAAHSFSSTLMMMVLLIKCLKVSRDSKIHWISHFPGRSIETEATSMCINSTN